MSGRYALFKINNLQERFRLTSLPGDVKRRYNISPTQAAPVVVLREDVPQIELMKWGLVPQTAKDMNSVFRYKTFEARSEGILTKNTWADAVRHQRCLVPANGFYAWQTGTDGKKPYYIHPTDQELFAFAGIYSSWRDPNGEECSVFALLTTTANKEMAYLNDRMPVILQPQDEMNWLERTDFDTSAVYEFARPYPDGTLNIYPVGDAVNGTKTDNPRLITPIVG